MKHSQEPWTFELDAHGRGKIKIGNDWIATAWTSTNDDNAIRYPADKNSQRIVDCVNGCAGLNPEAVADVVKHLAFIHREVNGMHCTKRATDRDYATSHYGRCMDELIKRNAELLERIRA